MTYRRRARRRFVGWLLAATAFSVSAASAQQGSPEDRAPVALRKSLLLTPVETAGTGLAPEVKVRVEVDARGRVTEVASLAVTPTSEYDHLFEQVTREEISGWRYAPEIKAGKAVATTLEWTVKFRARENRESIEKFSWLPMESAVAGGAESRRARILGLPLEQRKELLRRHSKVAEKFIDRGNRQRSDSPRFVVVSDAPQESTAKVTAGNLEAISTSFTICSEVRSSRSPSRSRSWSTCTPSAARSIG